MLLPEKMCKIYVVGLKDKRKAIVDYLYNSSMVHLEESLLEGSSISLSKEEIEDLEMNTKIDSLFFNLEGIVDLKSPSKFHEISKKERKKAFGVISKLGKELKEIEELKDQIREIKEQYEIADLLVMLNVGDLKDVKNIENHVVIIGKTNKENSRKLKEIIKRMKEQGNIEAFVREGDEEDYFLVVALKDVDLGGIISLLDVHHNLHELYDKFKDVETNVAKLYNYLYEKVNALSEKYDALLEKIRKDYAHNKSLLWDVKYYLNNVSNKVSGYEKLKEKDYVFMIKGYIPCDEVNKFVEGLRKVDPNVLVRVEEAELEKAPVKLKYPKLLRGIHMLVEAYGLPAYRYIDPSLLMLFTFPVFYGFVLGDIGYGLVLLALSFGIMGFSRNESLKLLANVLMLGGISTIFFGVLFGEFFGFSSVFGFKLPSLMHRMEKITELIVVSLLFGFFHINSGLILGIIQDVMYGRFMHALTTRFSWMLLQLGIGLLAYGLMGNEMLSYVGGLIIALSVFLLYKGEGFTAIFELPSIFTNILSYARLGAVGLSSIAIAFAINLFVEMFFAKGVWWGYLVGILIFVVGHTFNIVLGIISPFLHSLRLHYVEYFTKFYKSGGKKFVPYGKLKNV